MKKRADLRSSKGQSGFTLIELSVVLAVLTLMAMFSVPKFMESINEKRSGLTIQETQAVLDAARTYRMKNGAWPGDSTCSNAKSVLEGTNPPMLAGVNNKNKFNSAISTQCTTYTFSVTQNIIKDWDGDVANGLPATTITDKANHTIRSTIGVPGTEPALSTKLSRVSTGNPEDNRMRATLLLGGQSIAEGGDIQLSKVNPTISAQNGSLNLSSASQDVSIAAGNMLTADDIRIRTRNNALLSDLLPNYVQKGTYLVRHGWGVIKPTCSNGGIPKASLRPGMMSGGYNPGVTGSGIFGFVYRLIDNGKMWIVQTDIWGTAEERNKLDSLVDVYCYYP
ncbi:prepilin-type N-terminal cleavage/methylation domain-containing protein [Pseudomonas sp. P66]|uniref:Prepilin-type N-terminal cleavage/methylation domain-containing protein n=1 Tax=Pseudomonas arcuscaelestis TaxID=2710591 RepID=A0ABS2BZC1_9PSED|nr:prepilin-type N-terminal cleavage/methylation domain-containing protein [Pseudomonas arcuscaelestis]MBM5458973.1 prepilin-type N-terminal cleavage/methylation domain-containing protein [Pseudomonas arcuscaelestis]